MRRRSPTNDPSLDARAPSRVVAVVAGIETYRSIGIDAVAGVPYARADAEEFATALRAAYSDIEVDVQLLVNENASLIGLRESIGGQTKALRDNDLFVLYYAGHGFCGKDGNRLAAWDMSRLEVIGTTLSLDDVIEPLRRHQHAGSLMFLDACAAGLSVVRGGEIDGLDAAGIEASFDGGRNCGVFLSCSPGEKSYASVKLGHGVWTSFLLRAMRGEAEDALTSDRWLTHAGLRDWLRIEVPRFITRELSVRGSQTPQAILDESNTFRIRQTPESKEAPALKLSGLPLKNCDEYLQGVETGAIRQIEGFNKRNKLPNRLADSADRWVRRLLSERIAREMQELYSIAKEILSLKSRDMRMESGDGQGELDAPMFRYSVASGQNPANCKEYAIQRRLVLRSGWTDKRSAIESIFGSKFQRMVIEIDFRALAYADIVDRFEDVQAANGGSLQEDIGAKRVAYSAPDGAEFVIDLGRGRLEMSFGGRSGLEIIDAARNYKLQLTGPHSPMVAPPES
jgi:Caspase domain